MTEHEKQLLTLLNRLVENDLSTAESAHLTELLKASPQHVRLYLEFIELHGQLMWNAGMAGGLTAAEHPQVVRAGLTADSGRRRVVGTPLRLAAIAVVLAAVVTVSIVLSQRFGESSPVTAENGIDSSAQTDQPQLVHSSTDHRDASATAAAAPIQLDNLRNSDHSAQDPVSQQDDPPTTAVASHEPAAQTQFAGDFSDAEVVDFIDSRLRQSWAENEVQPSPQADDSEWLRRVYLTYTGRIPTLAETVEFQSGRLAGSRPLLIQRLSRSQDRAENLSEIWANLLVGRSPRPDVNRDSLQNFLRAEFFRNRPWIDTVGELVSAEGRSDENGATNFLLAHLNNDATPATAVTARLFLGEQLQCVQCHDHPFAKEITQRDYWEFNAFFQQTARVSELVPGTETETGEQRPRQVAALVDQPKGGMTFYENLAGEQQAVLPEFGGTVLSGDAEVDRRETLVQLLAADSETRVARAMVNRMWAHFFGYGFTRPIDDIGPHVPVSHPELLDGLTQAFVESGYDLQRLMSWIALSQGWQRSSRLTAENLNDDPESGETPLFSRVYIRRMTPEQVYRSIRVAVRSAADLPQNNIVWESDDDRRHRRYWVAQFVRDYETDENDEAADFDGTVAQALVMMNGDDVDEAIRQVTERIVTDGSASGQGRPISLNEALNRVARALLTRAPTEAEEIAFRARFRTLKRSLPGDQALQIAVEDMLWAYLNSSEFMLIH